MAEGDSSPRQSLDQAKSGTEGTRSWNKVGGPEGAEAVGTGRKGYQTNRLVHKLADGTGQGVNKY